MTLDQQMVDEVEGSIEAAIRVFEQPIRRKLAINRMSGEHLVICCVCKSGISYDSMPIHYNEAQQEELKRDYTISHGYCRPCKDKALEALE